MVVDVVEVCTVHERPCVVVPAFLKSLDRFLIRELIIMLSALISIFYLLIRYCSLELQKIVVRFSRENVTKECIPFLKSLDRLLIREFIIMLSAF